MPPEFILDDVEEKVNEVWVTISGAKRPEGKKIVSIPVHSLCLKEIDQDVIDQLGDREEDDLDMLVNNTVDWKGVKHLVDDKPEELPFDPDRYANLLKKLWYRTAVINAVMTRMAGGGTSKNRRKTKN